MSYKELTPEEAAALIEHGENIGFSGFTAAGVPKAVPRAIAARAIAEHEAGRPFKVNIFTGASTSASADGAALEFRDQVVRNDLELSKKSESDNAGLKEPNDNASAANRDEHEENNSDKAAHTPTPRNI